MQKCYWIYKSGNRRRVLEKLEIKISEPSAQMVFKNRRLDRTSKGWAKKGFKNGHQAYNLSTSYRRVTFPPLGPYAAQEGTPHLTSQNRYHSRITFSVPFVGLGFSKQRSTARLTCREWERLVQYGFKSCHRHAFLSIIFLSINRQMIVLMGHTEANK